MGVGAVPGSSFFKEPVNNLIRLHFAKKDETLNEALNRLADIRKKIPVKNNKNVSMPCGKPSQGIFKEWIGYKQ